VKHKSKRDGKVSASAAIPIATSGEVFDGAMIELVRDVTTQSLRLLLWHGAKETVGPLVEYQRRFYEPVAMSRSLLRELTLPTHSSPHGTTCALLAEICKLAADFILLPEKLASLVGRVVLASWLLEAAQIAPALAIIGPDISRGTQLLDLLHCLCRHPVRMTGVTPAGLCSLPTGLGCTLLISQPTISDKMQRLLADASRRDQKIPYRGGLLDLHGCQAIHSESDLENGPWSFRYLQIPILITGQRIPVLDASIQNRIASEFQAKLLDFRRANLGKACGTRFDAASFSHPLRPLVQSLAAATPDDVDLQAEVGELLREEEKDARSAKWLDFDTVMIEAILVACKEKKGPIAYVGDLAKIAQEIWKRRGKNADIDPGEFGKKLKALGFTTEPRDAKGIKLELTQSVCSRAHQLARDFGVPEAENGER
jgi:hypothetical protein